MRFSSLETIWVNWNQRQFTMIGRTSRGNKSYSWASSILSLKKVNIQDTLRIHMLKRVQIFNIQQACTSRLLRQNYLIKIKVAEWWHLWDHRNIIMIREERMHSNIIMTTRMMELMVSRPTNNMIIRCRLRSNLMTTTITDWTLCLLIVEERILRRARTLQLKRQECALTKAVCPSGQQTLALKQAKNTTH